MVLTGSEGKVPAMKSAVFIKPKPFEMPGELPYDVILSFS